MRVSRSALRWRATGSRVYPISNLQPPAPHDPAQDERHIENGWMLDGIQTTFLLEVVFFFWLLTPILFLLKRIFNSQTDNQWFCLPIICIFPSILTHQLNPNNIWKTFLHPEAAGPTYLFLRASIGGSMPPSADLWSRQDAPKGAHQLLSAAASRQPQKAPTTSFRSCEASLVAHTSDLTSPVTPGSLVSISRAVSLTLLHFCGHTARLLSYQLAPRDAIRATRRHAGEARGRDAV